MCRGEKSIVFQVDFMKKNIFLILFTVFFVNFLSLNRVVSAQGESNLSNRLFTSTNNSAKTAKPKSNEGNISNRAKATVVKEKTVRKIIKNRANKQKITDTNNKTSGLKSTLPIQNTSVIKTTPKVLSNNPEKPIKLTLNNGAKPNITSVIKSISKSENRIIKKHRAEYIITFITRNPNVEVYIDEELVGKTNDKFELHKTIEEGTYNVAAKYDENEIVEKTITVEKNEIILLKNDNVDNVLEANSTETTLVITPIKEPVIESQPIAVPTPKEVEKTIPVVVEDVPVKEIIVKEVPIVVAEKVLSISDKLQIILGKYYDPNTMDSLVESDWQFIRQALLSNETADLSPQDVEMFGYLSLGKLDLYKGNFNTAISDFNKAFELNPKSPYPFIELGNAYYVTRTYILSQRNYAAAIQFDANLWNIHIKLARSLLKINDSKNASLILEKVNQSEFKSPETVTLEGEIYSANKQFDKVISLLFDETTAKPQFDNCLVLADAFVQTGKTPNAIRFLKIADELSPNNSFVLYRLGLLLLPTNKSEALTYLNKSLELDKSGTYIPVNEVQKLIKKASK